MICPNCKKEVIFEMEDNRADTDRGVYSAINYFCPSCDSDIGVWVMRKVDVIKRLKVLK